MTHRKDDKAFGQVLEVLIENELDGMASALEVILNEAMKLERSGFLKAVPISYGYSRLHVLLRSEGWPINHKYVYRLC